MKTPRIFMLSAAAALLFSCAPARPEESPEPAASITPAAADTPLPSSAPEETADQEGYSYTMEEAPIKLEDKFIAGKTYLPDDGRDKHPLVILCHGIGVNYNHVENFAMMFAERGIAAYAFDFCGGGDPSRSSGTMLEMSVHTEEEDLNDVIDYIKERGLAEENKIYLLGMSQGGYVTTEAAAHRPDDIAGMMLFFPAFNINDLIAEYYPSPESVPETVTIFDQTVSRRYFLDAMAEPIEDDMRAYNGPVLLLHGSDDPVVPPSYSADAAECFPDAELHYIAGAEHGFFGPHADEAFALCMNFLNMHLN